MKEVWKFPCQMEPWGVALPKGAKILSFGDQRGTPYFWALVDPNQPPEDREFIVVGTGHPAPDESEGSYIGTCQQMDGMLVWHLFELRGEP